MGYRPGHGPSGERSATSACRSNAATTAEPRSEGDLSHAEASSTQESTNGNREQTEDGHAVVRSTSIRSIITLPQYTQTPTPTEQVIGREGERAGVDRIVDYPETVDEEEERREEEMESLYQIRQARRREASERIERRSALREARRLDDRARITQLREESRRSRQRASGSQDGRDRSGSPDSSAVPNHTSSQLIAQHQAIMSSRERRVASVEYADVGHVRHDGTRLRSTSFPDDSDSAPLLSQSRTNETRSGSGFTIVGDRSTLSHDSHNESFLTMASEQDQDFHYSGPPPQYAEMDLGEAPPYESSTNAQGGESDGAHESTPALNHAPETAHGGASTHRASPPPH